ncbi:uncharacterized protein K452DRAFT_291344 [Aplosporella prunicola CBS 121167]|uniref:Phosphoribosyltransferase domain-containing protein n=1 Tax=Aplosporella prunicola CBS 121167 TaxID=1176127 RepID=A0A6A6B3D1_9PEZI|nr:uncharacterized protein K452DRAFT_291344 [Aplosporella prunicola CBS 121167]KAF2137765.1 hypothetical protein K452DRAFT_291344 [Aplosporella prunicola CBS 121167]
MTTSRDSNTPSLTAVPQLHQSTVPQTRPTTEDRLVVVGLYGVPGSGKTFLLNQLKQELGSELFAFYEGSEVIDTVVSGGLDAFKELGEQEKAHWRQIAIDKIKEECAHSGRVAVVAGHFMFWPEEEKAGCPVYTQTDLETYTHILYLDVPAETIAKRRLDDTERNRPSASITHLRKWQQAEKDGLRRLCRDHGILFSLIFPHLALPTKTSTLLRDFQRHNEKHNLSRAERKLDEAIPPGKTQLETVLVLDADRTLAAEDTGTLFWRKISNNQDQEFPLKALFSSPLEYSYNAFRQATLLYEETLDDQEFEDICQKVAPEVTIQPEFGSLLHLVADKNHVGAVVVTCGLRRVWEIVLEREGLSKTVTVIGGGRISDGFVVTAAVKAALVTRLRIAHQVYIWAFGDSVLDLDMLIEADEAIVVVGEEQSRSKTMDAALTNAIDKEGLRAQQVVLPSNAPPRLNTEILPLIQLTGNEFIGSILCRRDRPAGLQIHLATEKNAAKLLATPMRDAAVAGPILRDAHRRVGWYLATEFLTDLIGIEECRISHVLGRPTNGYRLLHEDQTTIVALMRAGEPMALGVNDAFPRSMFVHASHPNDVKLHHLHGQRTVLLVDSVVNSGKTVAEFLQAVRNLNSAIRIIVVAGVVQAQCMSRRSLISKVLSGYGDSSLVALRLSDTKFTGSGTTDTGNRLYNTTHLP